MDDSRMLKATKKQTPRFSRRQFLKISAVTGGLLAGGGLLRMAKQTIQTVKETRLLMGTLIHLALVTDDERQGERVVGATFAEIERLVQILDHRNPQATLAQLNETGALADAPDELLTVLDQALAYGALSGGAFDVSVQPLVQAYRQGSDVEAARNLVDYRQIQISGNDIRLRQEGMQLTLDGIAKGYIVDSAVAFLQAQNFTNVLVEAGGDLASSGQRSDGENWRVGIQHPRATGGTRTLSTLQIGWQAVATSGDYMNSFSRDFSQHHIIDPRTGISPLQLSSVTVIAPSAMDADALSTAVMVLGLEEGTALLERLPHVAGLLVSKTLDLWPTSDFPALDSPL